jgi:myo-inositol-1(or 4)-monophosphatase
MKNFIDIAKQACLLSGNIQMENFGRVQEIGYKGEINLVTEIDKKCEREIVALIQGEFPTHDILAEEGTGRRKDSEYKWIIDPLDGTTNYAHGYPLFCTSIALEYKGEIVLGAVYEPNLKEIFLAEKNSGATLNEKKLSVSKTTELKQALLSTGFAYNVAKAKENNLNHFQNFIFNAQAVRRDGVAAIDLCYTAAGRFDGFWELELFPWDVAAGYLIVKESGGKVSDFSERPFNVYSKEILASNGKLHQAMIKILKMK